MRPIDSKFPRRYFENSLIACFAVSPGDGGSKETRHLDVLTSGETVWDGDGVRGDEIGAFVELDFAVEQFLELEEVFSRHRRR